MKRSFAVALVRLSWGAAGFNFPYESSQLTDAHISSFSAVAFGDIKKAPGSPTQPACKVYPGTSQWPAEEDWAQLNKTLEGALLRPAPPASVCYPGPSYASKQCSFLLTGARESRFYINDPLTVLTQWPQGDTCLLSAKPTGNCTQGGFPVYVVNVTTVRQIQAAVNFARNKHVRLVIKNTGHDFVGRSTGAGALSLWTHYLKSFEFLPEHSQPNYHGMAARVGSGLEAWELYHHMDKHNMTLVVPGGSTVGAYGGWMAGGGHSILGSLYGLGSDQVLSLQVVTADGRFVTADPETNQDLFFALRGGGPGTYGVVTSAIVKAYPPVYVAETPISFSVGTQRLNYFNFSNFNATPTSSGALLPPTSTAPFPQGNQTRPTNRPANMGVVVNSTEVFWRGVDAYFAFGAALCDAGGTGYNYVQGSNGSYSFRTNLELPGMTPAQASAFLRPLFTALHAAGVAVNQTPPVTSLSWGSSRKGEGDSPGNGRFATRLFPRAAWDTTAGFAAAMRAVRAAVEAGYAFHGVQVAPADRTQGFPGRSAVNPAFRAALMHADLFDRAPARGASAAAAREARARFARSMDLIRAATPGSGAYVNEADPLEPDWQRSFWGDGYPRLLEIKRARDPWGVFWAPTTVGSEEWEVRDGREDDYPTQNGPLCRVGRGEVS